MGKQEVEKDLLAEGSYSSAPKSRTDIPKFTWLC
jgi:hypothetical protein